MKILRSLNAILNLNPYILSFCTGLLLMVYYIFPLPDLLGGGGDARSIWQTIITFYDDSITSSYVLYKGFLSVYPYVWLYNLAEMMGVDSFVFIKSYHSLLFSYTAGIGIPYIVTQLLSVKPSYYRNVIFVVLIFNMIYFTHALQWLMVDLPSWAFYTAAVSFTLIVYQKRSNVPLWLIFIAAIFIGVSSCMSGQYSLAVLFLLFFLIIALVKINEHKNRLYIILASILIITGISLPKTYDIHFEKTIVQPMRDRGDWLPKGSKWLYRGLTKCLPVYKYGGGTSIPSNRGIAIIKQQEKENFSDEKISLHYNGHSYSIKQHLKLIKNNPVDFFVMWGTRLFLAVSFDDGRASVFHLFISYSALYLCLFFVFRKKKTINDILDPMSLVIISYISTIAAPTFLHIEMRYAITLQSFIVGTALLDDFIWMHLYNLFGKIKQSYQRISIRFILMTKVSYPFIIYLIFMIICIMMYGALLEISGSDPNRILFRL